MHRKNKSSHYIPSATEAAEMKHAAALGDDIAKRLAEKHRSQKLYTHRSDLQQSIEEVVRKAFAPVLKGSARGDDGDRRQMIADLISSDDSPFTPDDEEALRYMPDETIREMSRQYLKLKRHTTTAVANRSDPAFKAMCEYEAPVGASPEVQRMVANMNASRLDNERRSQRALEYCRRNPISRAAPVTNSNDEAVQAMSANIGAVEFLRRGKR